jgi:20S proteasome alpha/beta subunit
MTTNIDEKILHGTTTVGIKASDGVVLIEYTSFEIFSD